MLTHTAVNPRDMSQCNSQRTNTQTAERTPRRDALSRALFLVHKTIQIERVEATCLRPFLP